MGKGDHPRSWAHSIGPVKFAERYDALDWQAAEAEDQTVRVCMDCRGPKPSGKWCATCDRETDSERVYLTDTDGTSCG